MTTRTPKLPACRAVARAFSMIEVLVALGIIFLLLALALPPLLSTRRVAINLQCMARLAEMNRFLPMYATDFQGYFPSFIDDADPAIRNGDWRRWGWYNQRLTNDTLRRPEWTTWSGLTHASKIYLCPRSIARENYEYPPRNLSVANSSWVLSSTLYHEPRFYDPDLTREQWSARFWGKVQQLADVAHPSSKATMFEYEAWHAYDGPRGDEYIINGDLLIPGMVNAPTSVGFADGSADSINAKLHRTPGVSRAPQCCIGVYDATVWGVLGVDR